MTDYYENRVHRSTSLFSGETFLSKLNAENSRRNLKTQGSALSVPCSAKEKNLKPLNLKAKATKYIKGKKGEVKGKVKRPGGWAVKKKKNGNRKNRPADPR